MVNSYLAESNCENDGEKEDSSLENEQQEY